MKRERMIYTASSIDEVVSGRIAKVRSGRPWFGSVFTRDSIGLAVEREVVDQLLSDQNTRSRQHKISHVCVF